MTVTFSLAGYTAATDNVTLTQVGVTTQDVALTAVASLSGTLTDAATGQPISGAQLTLGTLTASSGTDGSYTFTQLAAGAAQLAVTAAGYTSATQSVMLQPGANSCNVQLCATSADISGVIGDAVSGAPLAQATVSGDAGTATADATGHYTLTGVTPGTHQLTAAATGYAAQTRTVTCNAGAVTTVNFALPGQGSLQGTITDATSGQPLAGATVTVDSTAVITNAAGYYTFPTLTAGVYNVQVSATGYTSATLSATLAPGQTLTLNGTLTAIPSATGVVCDLLTGAVLPNVQVSAGTAVASTNTSGQFVFYHLTPGVTSFTFTLAGYAGLTQTVNIPAAPATLTLDVALQSVGNLSGIISDSSTGQPIAGATVTVAGQTSVTDAGGNYQFTALDSGALQLTASASGYLSLTQAVTIAAGQNSTLNLTL